LGAAFRAVLFAHFHAAIEVEALGHGAAIGAKASRLHKPAEHIPAGLIHFHGRQAIEHEVGPEVYAPGIDPGFEVVGLAHLVG